MQTQTDRRFKCGFTRGVKKIGRPHTEAGVEATRVSAQLMFIKKNKRTGLVDRRKNTTVSNAPCVMLTKLDPSMFGGGKHKPASVLELENARAERMKETSMRERKREKEAVEKEAALSIDIAPTIAESDASQPADDSDDDNGEDSSDEKAAEEVEEGKQEEEQEVIRHFRGL